MDYSKIRIRDIEAPRRVTNILRRNGIYYLSDLLTYNDDDLLKFRCMGSISLWELKQALKKQFNLDFNSKR